MTPTVLFAVLLLCAAPLLGWVFSRPLLELRRAHRARLSLLRTPFEALREGSTPTTEAPDADTDTSLFRAQRKDTRFSRYLEHHFPLLDPRKTFRRLLLVAFLWPLSAWLAAVVVLRYSTTWVLLLILFVSTIVVLRAYVGWMSSRELVRFSTAFPDVVDQIVRLARIGMPPFEALSMIGKEVQPPVSGVLSQVGLALEAGLDADRALRLVTDRVRIPEFTMFCVVLTLQRRAGGLVSEALGNLSTALRDRRRVAQQAHSASAQTRLSLIILLVLPVVVLGVQRITAPATFELLFNTEQGLGMLRLGVGLSLLGVFVAWLMGRRLS